jgi:hypothetical protein
LTTPSLAVTFLSNNQQEEVAVLNISADLSSMSHNQREALADFIISFPQAIATEDPSSPEKVFTPPLAIEVPEVKAGPQLVTSTSTASNLDKAGLPWDERIHSSSRALTADGLWRKKRGVDDALVAQVESQLKQLMALPTPAAVSVAPVIAAPSVIASVPPPPPTPIAEVTDGRQAFINLVSRVSAAIPAKKITMDEVVKACNDAGVPTLPLLANRADLISQVAMTIEALIASR